MRDKKKVTDAKIKHVCTICSLSRQLFDKQGHGFDHHIEHEHNPWNYIFFLYGLRKKDVTEYTGMETYVHEMQKRDDIDWVPIMRALSVGISDTGEDNKVEQKIHIVLEELQKINNALQSK